MKKIKEILDQTNIKPTYERLRIIKYFEENNNHPTINMIYKEVVKDIPTISKTTIYNALNLFVQKGLVLPLVITGTEVRYDRNTKPHHHFLCEKCRKIYDINIECPYFKKGYVDGHKITELHGYFKGTCKECLKKESNFTLSVRLQKRVGEPTR
ncbi:MAG: transcriptional repressor [Candidatus Cloacimonetes bacterium]|nr:transcriptional repressor [Candidatus Cloacimonadota bacterium]